MDEYESYGDPDLLDSPVENGEQVMQDVDRGRITFTIAIVRQVRNDQRSLKHY